MAKDIPEAVRRALVSQNTRPRRVELPGPGQYELPRVTFVRGVSGSVKGTYVLQLETETQEILLLPISEDAMQVFASLSSATAARKKDDKK